ncbi:MAG: hypothetical protein A2521_01720 [Deltaproteobacteria bacterium RIFOXYD12_FULL_57_12]|nr:MAG: hypothetical protein A2521_01720 [Deltaproteobacteria bacterium RIFOXYD12_FULL_57_12]
MDPIKRHEHDKASIEKHKQMEIPLALIKIQETYNTNNLNKQYGFNLEIFVKQSELTREIQTKQEDLAREIHEKQSKLTKRITIITAACSIIASIIGAIVGGLTVFWVRATGRWGAGNGTLVPGNGTLVLKQLIFF